MRRLRCGVVLLVLAVILAPGGWRPARATLRPVTPGTVLAWGTNATGELGDSTTIGTSSIPGQVCGGAPCTAALSGVVSVAGGSGHSLALLSDGTVMAWGLNNEGQLGDGTTVNRGTPVRVCALKTTAPCSSFLGNVIAVAAGQDFSLALMADGTVQSWGRSDGGQLGDGTTVGRTTPVQVCDQDQIAPCGLPLSNITAIAAGSGHAVALKSSVYQLSGNVVAWGRNGNGQLGYGAGPDRTTPINVCGVNGCSSFYGMVATAIAAYGQHSLAVQQDGSVAAWGDGFSGDLGDGTQDPHSTPVRVCDVGQTAPCGSFLSGVTGVAAGNAHSLALRGDGSVVAWGWKIEGQVGDGTGSTSDSNQPVPVAVCDVGQTAPCSASLSNATAIAAAGDHSLAVLSDGTVAGWGDNTAGQLGDGTTANRFVPVQACDVGQSAACPAVLSGIAAVAAGAVHTLAVQP